MVKNLIKMPLENRVNPVVLRERGGKIMMIMMVAVARYFDGSWLGVIQQLRGPNFTQFWPPTLLEWTIGNNFHNTYSLLTWPSVDFLLTTYSPLRSYWMPPKICVIYVALYIYYIIMAQCKIHTLFFAFGNLIAKQFYNYVF